MWFILALSSAVFLSFKRIAEKDLSGKLSYFTLGWSVQLFSLPLIALVLAFNKGPYIIPSSLQFWGSLLIIWAILYPVQTYCYYRAIKEGELSEVLPILSFIPVFTLLFSSILIREIPSTLGLLGIFFTVAGVFVLHLKSSRNIPHIFHNKSALLMGISSFSVAIGSTLDKVALKVSVPQLYTLVNVIGATCALFFISQIQRVNELSLMKKYWKSLIAIGIFQSLFYSLYTFSLTIGITSYVVALRSLNVLLGALIGIFLFKERATKRKLVSFLLILLGLISFAFAK